MKKLFLILIISAACLSFQNPPKKHYLAYDIIIDSKEASLAAWQVKIDFHTNTRILSIEGGESDSFNEPPFYDNEAMEYGSIIIANFTTEETNLPTNTTRVARIMIEVTGDPTELKAALQAVADQNSKRIKANLTLKKVQK